MPKFFHRRFSQRVPARRRMRFLFCVAVAWGLSGPIFPARAEDVAPYPRISEEAFKARRPFFDYDKTLPLEGRVVRQWDKEGTLRQKIVFRSAQGFLVPGYIEAPKAIKRPYPLVLLLHGWSGAKEG